MFRTEFLFGFVYRGVVSVSDFCYNIRYSDLRQTLPNFDCESRPLRKPTGTPLPTPVADVITVAKRDLKAGEILDGSGGYTVNGLIERADIAREENLLPLGLEDDIPLKCDVSQGEAISYDMVT